MIPPNPVVIASMVPAKPTPAASPRYRDPRISEITGSMRPLMMSAMTSTIAIVVCRATMGSPEKSSSPRGSRVAPCLPVPDGD